ncbi:hypothetical protein [Moritella sp. Urea-trap-13]|uniref:hypothetical protein n=1 Tax=Moritella sp. Urea-trap-13 TaxID=2058327 RepID=UPI000C326A77|nr:hypothetical protein [Moritella sp. Urea-trap-13]PKH07136.1 hypothetical protein CXF93_14840 [Moritella sp. Urea-trap-13]
MDKLKWIFIVLTVLLAGCSSSYSNQSLVGQTLPTFSGQTLEQQDVSMPGLFANKPTLLLVGYKQDTQFDIDRWLIGLDMSNALVDVYELPAIQGMFPKMFSSMINNGMRRGIPKELWGGVITLYNDGEKMQQYTGNENPNNARVILLDANSEIVYFYDRGFSVDALNKLGTALDKLELN